MAAAALAARTTFAVTACRRSPLPHPPHPTPDVRRIAKSRGAAARSPVGCARRRPAVRSPSELPDERVHFRAALDAARPGDLLFLHALRQRAEALHRFRVAGERLQEPLRQFIHVRFTSGNSMVAHGGVYAAADQARPNSRATVATIRHRLTPNIVGSSAATPAHFQLCVSFLMTMSVVEHGQ